MRGKILPKSVKICKEDLVAPDIHPGGDAAQPLRCPALTRIAGYS